MSAFITDGSFHLASTVIRSIGKHHVEVYAGDSINYRFGSRFCKDYFQYPFPASPSFIPSLYGLLEKTHSRVLIPMSNTTIVPVAQNIKMLDEITTTPIADYSAIVKAMDKFETYLAAISSGIPVPKTYRISSLQDLHNRAADTGYPLILKPATSEGSSAGVLRVESDSDLESFYHRINQIFGTVLLQEYIPGESRQMRMVNVLFDCSSQPVAVFTARKIREYPVTGGITTLGESTWEPDLAELGVKLMSHLKWKGVAEIEFKVDPRDNIPRMIEINPRFWSYLQLPICCGVDFPYLLYKVGCGDSTPPQEKYKTGIRYVHPIRDLMSVIAGVKKTRDLQDLLRIPSSYSGIRTTAYSFVDDPMLILEKPWISIKKMVIGKKKREKND